MPEEHVDFVPKPGVTLYIGGGRYDHDPKAPARIPKSAADGWEHLRHKPDDALSQGADKLSATAAKPAVKKAGDADPQA